MILFTGDLLHKKWKNVRDRFVRDFHERRGLSEDSHKKPPYLFTEQLDFLRPCLVPKNTVSSLERISAGYKSVPEEREEETEDDDDELQEAISTFDSHAQVDNKRLHAIEARILNRIEKYERKAKRFKVNEENDNRQFLLSLLPSLESLPRNLNTRCRIDIMQTIDTYENMRELQQQPMQSTHIAKQEPSNCQVDPLIMSPAIPPYLIDSTESSISNYTDENDL